jgi:hypothetical protein
VVDVASLGARRGAAGAAEDAVDRDEVDQRAAGAQLDQADLVLAALDRAAEDVAVERERAVEVDDAQHDVVDLADPDHGHAPARWTPASTHSTTSATFESVNAARRWRTWL